MEESEKASHRAKHHENLYAYDYSPYWQFRKYSSEKRKDFSYSTGIPKGERLAAKAHRVGMDAYNAWLGRLLPISRAVYINDLARVVKKGLTLRSKNHRRSITSQLDNHVLPFFGHYRADQITKTLWIDYEAQEREKGERKALFNTRKALMMCLSVAVDQKLIKELPEIPLNDPEAASPVHIPLKDYRLLRRATPGGVKLMVFWCYYMGPRPTEALSYRRSMINLTDGPTGRITIPGAITKTRRKRSIPLERHVYRAMRLLLSRLKGDAIMPGVDDDTPLKTYNAVWDRAIERLADAGHEFTYTAYNLRDTFITDNLRKGRSAVYLGKYTDTSATMIEKKYAVSTDDIMQEIANGRL